MAIKKEIVSTSFSIEVANGLDAAGDTKYTKKTFSGIKDNVNVENVYDVGLHIRNILSVESRSTLINVTSELSAQA